MNILSLKKQKSIRKYETAFGPKHEEFRYLIRTISGIGTIVCVIQEFDDIYVVKDQVLIKGSKIYRNNELVWDFSKNKEL